MAVYSPTAATRRALINAAGTLFAERGVTAVTTREIAAEAKENPGLIHYHFGAKDDLLNAVVDFAVENWKERSPERYLADNGALLETEEGCFKLIDGLIDLAFDAIFSPEHPAWSRTLLFQLMQRDMAASTAAFEVCVKPIHTAFFRVHERLTGKADPAEAYAWTMTILSPPILLAANPLAYARLFKEGALPAGCLDSLRALCKANARSGLSFTLKSDMSSQEERSK